MSRTMGAAALSIVRPPSPKLQEFLKRVYARENAGVAGGSAATLADYEVQVRTLQKHFDTLCREQQEEPRPLTIDDICDAIVAGCMASMKQRGLSAGTCNKLRRTIKTIHTFAIVEKDLPLKPLRVKKYKEFKRKPRAWRPDQIGLLLAASKAMPGMVGEVPAGDWHYAHLLFLLNTGSRISASMATPTAWLDLEGAVVTVPAEVQKDGEDAVIELCPATVEALRRIRPQRHKRIFDDWPYDRGIRQWPTLTKRLKKMLVKAGFFPSVAEIPKRIELFHKLRRCFATFIAKTEGPEAAQQLLGHSHAATTQVYLDPTQTGERPNCGEILAGILKPTKHDPQQRLFE